MHALLRVFGLARRFRTESRHEQRISTTENNDVGICLDKSEGLLVIPQRQAGEAFKGGCKFW